MATPNSTARRAKKKPVKPYPDFPLFPHAAGVWAKKIRSKLVYFGPWDDCDGALQKYLDQKDDLHAGRTPRTKPDGLTLRELINRFLTAKRQLVDTGEMVLRSWQDYHASCGRLVSILDADRLVEDLAADDFGRLRATLAKGWGPVTLGNEIQRIRGLLKFGYDEGLIDKPIRYGQSFKRPGRKVLRKARHTNGKRMFEAHEIRAMIEAAGPQLKAMILLGLNCAFGNADCGTLPKKALDLRRGWIDYPRPKTGVARRCPLWRETIQALREAMASRTKPRDKADAGLVFITKRGMPWGKETADNPVTKETAKLLKRLGVHRKGVNFYALRHTFQTIGDEARDPIATRHIMGYAENSNDISAVCREAISDARLQAVADHVHGWLFPAAEESSEG